MTCGCSAKWRAKNPAVNNIIKWKQKTYSIVFSVGACLICCYEDKTGRWKKRVYLIVQLYNNTTTKFFFFTFQLFTWAGKHKCPGCVLWATSPATRGRVGVFELIAILNQTFFIQHIRSCLLHIRLNMIMAIMIYLSKESHTNRTVYTNQA